MPKNFQIAMDPLGIWTLSSLHSNREELGAAGQWVKAQCPACYALPCLLPSTRVTSMTSTQVTGSKEVIPSLIKFLSLPLRQDPVFCHLSPASGQVMSWPGSNTFSSVNLLTVSVLNKMMGAWAPKQVLQTSLHLLALAGRGIFGDENWSLKGNGPF